MLAKRMPTILPELTPGESIETTRIYSALGLLRPGQPLLATRPYRSPHHTISDAGLVGGGSTPSPGEISLSHNGVLFLGRVAGVQSPHAGSAAPAARRRASDHLAGPVKHDLSGQLSADRRVEPLPLRLPQRSAPRLPLHGAADRAVHEQDQRPAARPDRHPHRSARGGVQGAFGRAGRARRASICGRASCVPARSSAAASPARTREPTAK